MKVSGSFFGLVLAHLVCFSLNYVKHAVGDYADTPSQNKNQNADDEVESLQIIDNEMMLEMPLMQKDHRRT